MGSVLTGFRVTPNKSTEHWTSTRTRGTMFGNGKRNAYAGICRTRPSTALVVDCSPELAIFGGRASHRQSTRAKTAIAEEG